MADITGSLVSGDEIVVKLLLLDVAWFPFSSFESTRK
jgi:hypothetical protein